MHADGVETAITEQKSVGNGVRMGNKMVGYGGDGDGKYGDRTCGVGRG